MPASAVVCFCILVRIDVFTLTICMAQRDTIVILIVVHNNIYSDWHDPDPCLR
jgi:hypothetical protein